MEDGEISDHSSQDCNVWGQLGDLHDPAHEWPGEPSTVTLDVTSPVAHSRGKGVAGSKRLKHKRPSLRLVVLRTSILPSNHRLALVDGYSELQLGRDAPMPGTSTPRARLKEMEVSKLHATVFWDSQRLEWSVVDMGSKHGTFLKPGASTLLDDMGRRLSPPRVASVPKGLQHLDHLTLGSTTFVVHIHSNQVPCEACSPTGGDEIPLFHWSKTCPTTPLREASSSKTSFRAQQQQVEKDPKKALNALKHDLLSRHKDAVPLLLAPADNHTQYVDRSARRRALYPASHSESPGVAPLVTSPPTRSPSSPATSSQMARRSPEPVSLPQAPLASSNIGHRLLLKQGWAPGTTLGALGLNSDESRVALVEPLEINFTTRRSGLGHAGPKSDPDGAGSFSDWKERGLCNRWASLGQNDGSSEG